MARERNLHGGADEGRWPSAPYLPPEPVPDPAPDRDPDPIGQLDDVIATLEEMLQPGGVPPLPDARGPEGPERPEAPETRERPAGGQRDPGTLPLLRDVVAPAADSTPSFGGEPEDAGPEEDEPAPGRAPPQPRFELLPEEPIFPVRGLSLVHDPADLDAGGERYGDAPSPPLDLELYRPLIERVANEIDVIVQTGAEEAAQRAAAEIVARVREHLAITLPEVIGELVRMSSRPDD